LEASTEQREDQQEKEGRSGSGADNTIGRVEEVQGVVIEAVFPDENLPEINTALEIEMPDPDATADADKQTGEATKILVCEVQQHLGDDRVRAVAMDSTDGLSRGTEVRNTGKPISVPVGEVTLGRIFNLLGQTIDQARSSPRTPSAGRSTAPLRASRTSLRRARCSRRASRSSTCSPRMPRAARWACSAAPAWARRC
jgi:F0F1-type ATP synthase beta subunit